MRLGGRSIAKQAVILLFLVPILASCHRQQQNNARPPHEQRAQDQQGQEDSSGGGGRQRIRAVCADDIQKYCANADRKRRCLKDNMDKLSDACKAAVAKRGGGRGRRARDNDSGDD